MSSVIKVAILLFIVAAVTATICFSVVLKYSDMFTILDSENVNTNYNTEESNYVKILFVGDLMFDRGIRYYAEKNGGNDFIFSAPGGPASGWGTLSDFLKSNDLVIANLEGPITDEKSISAGTKPGSTNNYFFTFDPSVAKTLFTKNIRVVNLGNNHILNFKQAGVASTEKYLTDANVDYFGAPGKEKSIIVNINNLKVAFVSYNEFLNSDIKAEQNAVIKKIEEIKSEADIVIVFCHWGIEYKSTPTDDQKNLAHQFVDAKADLIIGSHPHVIQPSEEYKGKKIYYSLGNFIFDQHFNENVRNGLGVEVKIDKTTKEMSFKEHALYLQGNGQTIMK